MVSLAVGGKWKTTINKNWVRNGLTEQLQDIANKPSIAQGKDNS
jgi:hypothetical protein